MLTPINIQYFIPCCCSEPLLWLTWTCICCDWVEFSVLFSLEGVTLRHRDLLKSTGLNTNFLARLPKGSWAGNFTCPANGEFRDVPVLTNVLPGWTGRAALIVQPCQLQMLYQLSPIPAWFFSPKSASSSMFEMVCTLVDWFPTTTSSNNHQMTTIEYSNIRCQF